jgi:hypothetical protein
MRRALAALLWTVCVAACSGDSPSPTGPGGAASEPSTPPASTAGATINGQVANMGPASTTALQAGPLTVSVVGTSLSTTVASSGRFTLTGVPAGAVRLRFERDRVEAFLDLPPIAANSTVNIVVTVSGTTAALQTSPQSSSDVEFTGTVSSLSGTAPGATLVVAGRTVRTNASTLVRRRGDPVSFDRLRVGQIVEVDGVPQSDGSVLATRITIEDEAPDERDVEFTGALTSIAGTPPNLTLVIAGRTVRTDSGTEVRRESSGSGDGRVGLDALRTGQQLEVRGVERPDGTVFARRLEIAR